MENYSELCKTHYLSSLGKNDVVKKTANAHKKELGWCRAPHLNAERGRTLNKSD